MTRMADDRKAKIVRKNKLQGKRPIGRPPKNGVLTIVTSLESPQVNRNKKTAVHDDCKQTFNVTKN